MRWAAEEKAKTQRWCDEQTAAATKERNAAAKMARDSRQKALTGAVPIRCVQDTISFRVLFLMRCHLHLF